MSLTLSIFMLLLPLTPALRLLAQGEGVVDFAPLQAGSLPPLPPNVKVFPYDASTDTCFVVNQEGSFLLTFQAKNETFTKIVHCDNIKYYFENRIATGCEVNGVLHQFASNIPDPMGVYAFYGVEPTVNEENICSHGAKLIWRQLRYQWNAHAYKDICLVMANLFKIVPQCRAGR